MRREWLVVSLGLPLAPLGVTGLAGCGGGGDRTATMTPGDYVVVLVEELAQGPKALGDAEGDPKLSSYPEELARDLKGAGPRPLDVLSGAAFGASDFIASADGLTSCTY